jgi:hypothetical protein
LLVIVGAMCGARRKWVNVLGLCAAALVLFGCLIDVPGRYFQAPSAKDIHQQINAVAIFTTQIDAGTEDCSPTKWIHLKYCTKHEYAFVKGMFATNGVPRAVAIAAGIAAPILLLLTALFMAVWRRRPGTPV